MKKQISIFLPIISISLLLSNLLLAQSPDWFTKVTAQTGLGDTLVVEAIALTDINNDDYPDMVVMHAPNGILNVKDPIRILLNIEDHDNPTGRRFIDVTSESDINTAPNDADNHANVFTLADFNNDGNVDLVAGIYYHRKETYSYPDDRFQLYLGDGTGKFTLLPNSGLADIGLVNARSLTVLDYDKDGNLDLFISTWFKDYSRNIADHGYLLKGNGDGTFKDVTAASGIGAFPEPMYSASSMDFNDDCYPDIFTAPYCRTGGKVFKNNGDGTFSNVAAQVGYNLLKNGAGQAACTFTTTPEDINNDGYMDIFVSEVHGGNGPGQFRSTIAINKGPEHNFGFEIKEDLLPPTASTHRGDYDGAFADFENDGLKDLIMAQGGYMPATDRTYFFHQQPDHTFKDITSALGLNVPELRNSAMIEPIDFDLDGDDDLFICGAGGAYYHLWQNNIGTSNNRITVKLAPAGSGVNKSCIGARIYVHYGDKMQMREINAGRGMHAGQQPFILNFGLGDAVSVDSVIVRWPDKFCSRTKIENPNINEMLTVSNNPTHIQDAMERYPQFKIFPNPTERYLIIQGGNDLTDNTQLASISDINGRIVSKGFKKSDNDKLIFDLDKLPAGTYIITVQLKNGKTIHEKVTKK